MATVIAVATKRVKIMCQVDGIKEASTKLKEGRSDSKAQISCTRRCLLEKEKSHYIFFISIGFIGSVSGVYRLHPLFQRFFDESLQSRRSYVRVKVFYIEIS